MGELYLIFIGISILSTVSVLLMFMKNGKFVNNNNILIYLIAIYTVILGLAQYTSVPSNYIFGKFLGILFIILSIISVLFKKKNFLISRILLSISLIAPIYTLFFM